MFRFYQVGCNGWPHTSPCTGLWVGSTPRARTRAQFFSRSLKSWDVASVHEVWWGSEEARRVFVGALGGGGGRGWSLVSDAAKWATMPLSRIPPSVPRCKPWPSCPTVA
jgi:hypothetical protein